MTLINRIKLTLASLPAKLPTTITRPLEKLGFGKLYSRLGDELSNTGFVEVQYNGIEFEMEADLGNPTRTIEERGIYEPPVTKKVVSELEQGDEFIDVGASFGFFPLLAAHITNPESVYGIEPNPESREIFERNNRRITNDRITVSPYLIGNENCHTKMSLTVYSGLPAGEPKEIKVDTEQFTLDRYVEKFDIEPDFILADIDGSESELITGGENILSKHTPRLLIEIHPELLDDKGVRVSSIVETLEQVGYTIEYATSYESDDAVWQSTISNTEGKPFHIFAYQ